MSDNETAEARLRGETRPWGNTRKQRRRGQGRARGLIVLKADGSPTRGRGKENKSMSATAVCSRCNGLSRRPESLDTIHKELQATARSSGGQQIWGRRRRRDRAEGRSVIMKMHEQKKRRH